MILEDIIYSKKENLIKLVISNESFYVSYNFYSNLNLAINDEIDFNLYKEILHEDNYNRCKLYALKQISYSNKTSFDLKNKLTKKGFSKDTIDKVIKFLNSFDLIDDENYVKAFVNDKSNIYSWSKAKIKYKLKAKYIDDNLIEKYLDSISDEDEYEKAYMLAKRKFDLFYEKEKVFRFLANKAFSYDIIKKVIGDLYK